MNAVLKTYCETIHQCEIDLESASTSPDLLRANKQKLETIKKWFDTCALLTNVENNPYSIKCNLLIEKIKYIADLYISVVSIRECTWKESKIFIYC